MEKELDICTELAELNSRLAALPKLQPFLLPDNSYLKSLAAALAESAIAADNPEPASMQHKAMPFEVPAGYFDTLPSALMAQTDTAVQPSFAVPEGYFQQLPQQLLDTAKASDAPAGRSRPFRPLLRTAAPWLAAAALMAGIWIGIRPGTTPVSPDTQAAAALAALDRDSIGAYVELHAEDFDPESLEAAVALGSPRDLQDAVTELPETEILDYLNDAASEGS